MYDSCNLPADSAPATDHVAGVSALVAETKGKNVKAETSILQSYNITDLVQTQLRELRSLKALP